MDPQLGAAAVALLFGAAKIGMIGTVGFAIAWLRARSRIRAIEGATSAAVASGLDERLERLERTVDYMANQVDRIAEAQERERPQLPRNPSDR